MITRRLTRAWVLIVLISLFVMSVVGVWVFRLDRQGHANLRTCSKIQPGGGRAELVHTLGSPIASELNPARTRLVLLFGGPVFGSRSIRAVVNVRDDLVVEIDCGNGHIRTYDKY
jgi:hypothetical protein